LEFLFGAALYLAPTAIALLRKRPKSGGLIAVNILLGWTIVGWIWSFFWAFTSPKENSSAIAEPQAPEGAIVASSVLGTMWFDGREVGISRKARVTNLLVHGLDGVKHISIGAIQAVQLRHAKGGVRGYLQLTVTGAIESRGGAIAAAGDENTHLFDVQDQAAFDGLAKAIRDAIGRRHEPAPSATSKLDDLAKLAALKESGALSEDEFSAEKAKLLS
jgi:hypothetical protein